jgi:hypothetical protein
MINRIILYHLAFGIDITEDGVAAVSRGRRESAEGAVSRDTVHQNSNMLEALPT